MVCQPVYVVELAMHPHIFLSDVCFDDWFCNVFAYSLLEFGHDSSIQCGVLGSGTLDDRHYYEIILNKAMAFASEAISINV